jgi:hypothetical protein
MGIRAAKLKSYNWKYNHIKYMGSSYIGIWIAGIGVMVRHYIDPGNAKLGFIASGILALILIPILAKISNKYKLQEQKD